MENKTNRITALEWWNKLTPEDRAFRWGIYTRIKGRPNNDPNNSTGREVEEIWNSAFTAEQPKAKVIILKRNIKPNERQYTEFHEDLFIRYIHKFNLEDRQKMAIVLAQHIFDK